MDRYHLAWLMVGKPKAIVRGRPMTPDEEADYVREVAEQKTAALRMSLDAVERGGMPFVGETGGVGSASPVSPAVAGRRRRPRSRPRRTSDRPGPRRTTRGGPPPGRRPPRPRCAASTAPREDAAMTATGVPGPGRRRQADRPAARRRRARLHPARAPARSAHPGPRRRLLRPGRAQGRRSTWSTAAPRPACATMPPLFARGVAAEVAEPDRRDWLDVQLVALETQAAAAAGDALPYLDHVEPLLRPWPRVDPGRTVRRRPRRGSTPSSRAAARSTTGWPRGMPDSRSRSIGCRVSSTGSSSASGASAAERFGLPDGEDLRVGLVRDQPWAAYDWFDGGRRSRIDFNTDLPARASEPSGHRSPTRPTPATTSSTPRRRPSWSTARAASRRRSCSSTRPSASSAKASPTSASGSSRPPRSEPTSSSSSSSGAGLAIGTLGRDPRGRAACPAAIEARSHDARRDRRQRRAPPPRRGPVAR